VTVFHGDIKKLPINPIIHAESFLDLGLNGLIGQTLIA
jgi:hypothetical protein